jgi:putative spermidine/putrescine transport system ATP-binding protein
VTKLYGTVKALDDVSIDVRQGEFLTLLGPSGSGKTTLLMMIAGFVEPSSGRIMLGSNDISRFPPEARGFGMVFQGYALFPHMTIAENVAFPLRVRHVAKEEVNERVLQALDMVQLSHLANRRPRELSGGQQQRVALARALVFKPGLLLLDEPLSALDRKLRVEMQTELKQLHQRLGTSFVYVTHDQEEAMSMSDRVAVLHRGRLAQIDTPQQIYQQPKTHFVAGFLGESNFLAGRVTQAASDGFAYDADGASLRHAGSGHDVAVGDEVLVAVRAESIRLSAGRPAEGNALNVRADDWNYYGDRIKGVLRTRTGNTLVVNLPASEFSVPISESDDLWASWSTEASVPVAPD